jgi:predicted DNA-binding transcriptional regulator AlpA
MAKKNSIEALLTERDVSRLLQVSVSALRKWRVERRGPRFLKMGSLVRYRQLDVDVWLESLPTGGESSRPRIDEVH